MRKLAGGITGAFALLVMLVLQPWWRATCESSDCWDESYFGSPLIVFMGIAFYLLLPLIVLGVILVAVLGIRDTNRPHDLAVRAALGETQSSAVRSAAKRALRDGLVWVGAAYGIAALLHVAILALSGWPLTVDAEFWLARAVAGIYIVGVLVLAHVIDASRPRRSPVERLYEDARPVIVGRGSRVMGLVLGVIMAIACGVVVGVALANDLAPNFRATNAAGAALIVAVLAAFFLGLFVLVPAARVLVPAWLRLVGRWLRAPLGSIVSARATAGSRAAGRVVLVLGSFGLLFGAMLTQDPGPSVSPTYVGYRTFYEPIDVEAYADQLRAIDGVAAVLTPPANEGLDELGNLTTMFAVDPADLAGLDDGLARVLADHPDAIAKRLLDGSAGLQVGALGDFGFTPSGVVPMSTGGESFTSASAGMVPDRDTSAFLIYSTDPALNETIFLAAANLMPDGLDDMSSQGSGITGRLDTMWAWEVLPVLVFVIVGGAALAALAVGVARSRGSDDATLAALGATPRQVRAALTIETGAVGALALGVGLGLGALIHAGVAALQRARYSLTGVITDSYLATALGSVPWLALIAVLVASVSVMAAAAWMASARVSRELPAEQLRALQTGGSR